ncbi:MAG: CBS domain-containing protein [Rhodobacteraceae bacterium]|nr:CBS domain-containing protein [Paracoccaceae bacterium]
MTDSSAEPSSAAPAAAGDSDQGADESGQSRGLWTRLFDALTPGEGEVQAEVQADAPMRQVLPGLTNLRRLRVADVAIPKAEIVAVPRDIDREDLFQVFRDSGFSRIPVYNETLDKPMGLLLLKDLVLRHGFGLDDGDLDIDGMLRPLLFVPPSMPLVVLLQKMQTERTHMALVIDEYGGVDGLVTIEDLLEQVVGQIEDEHDTEDEHLWHAEKPGSWIVQARAQLDDLNAALGLDLREGIGDEDVDTLGGLVFLLLGRVPARGEVIALPAGHEIEVLEADPRRVKRLRLRVAGAVAAEKAAD